MNESEKNQIQMICGLLREARSKKHTLDYVIYDSQHNSIVVEATTNNDEHKNKPCRKALYEMAQNLKLRNINVEFYDEFLDDNNGIVLPDRKIVLPMQFNIQKSVSEVNNQLMKHIAIYPEIMHELEPTRFEEVVAEVYRKMGFEVVVTGQSRDGGVDIYIARNEAFGRVLYVVECKKYALDNPVGVGVIRNICGVLSMDEQRPTAGIVVTTSRFTRDAKEAVEESRMEHRIFLQDGNDLIALIRKLYLE